MINENLVPVTIAGIGMYVPETVIKNEDIAKIVDTNDDWISSRTGIQERRVVSGNETAVSLGVNAAKDALAYAGISSEQIDLVICATSMPDNLYPSSACEIQAAIGAQNAAAFDISAACSGLIYGLFVAKNFIMSGTYETVLVVGVDVHSRFLDWTDRTTCVLFGDGAGAFVVKKSDDGINDFLSVDIHADGTKGKELKIPLYGKNCPLVEPNDEKKQIVNMNGKEIYKFAVSYVPESILNSLSLAELTIDDLDFLVPHQANMRIISAIKDRLKLNTDQVISNLEKYGNTSTASIPIALLDALDNNRIPDSSLLALCGFGAGLTWGTAVIRWRAKDQRKL
ncbi:MAG: ketoacyl-ACP synthase III [Candidatus Gastranaerophilales bacterium]|nr:ketoacyl-ACP synthase III [Candidatus Gastranaerophilales bacterium]